MAFKLAAPLRTVTPGAIGPPRRWYGGCIGHGVEESRSASRGDCGGRRATVAQTRAAVSFAALCAALSSPALPFGVPPARAVEPDSGDASKPRTEFAAIPFAGGDSDVGYGAGAIVSLARVRPDREPYQWRLEAVGTTMLKIGEGDDDVRYADVYTMLSLPHLVPRKLGLTLRASFTRETALSYYGVGNATVLGGRHPEDPYFDFDWTHPQLRGELEYRLGRGLELVSALGYTYNSVRVPRAGKLAADAQSESADLRQLIRLVPDHSVLTVGVGLNWDTRDDEVAPERGHYHGLRLDFSPSAGAALPYHWMRANLTLRQYVQLMPKRLVLAGRLIVDALFGQPPFYELARAGNTFALGGTRGVRGIPAPRYYGMLKALSNLELRARLLSFELFEQHNELGVVAFTDAGRVVADYDALSELDGTGLGVKVAYGGGVRLRSGQAFVLRVDLAVSPAEDSSGIYVAAGHLF